MVNKTKIFRALSIKTIIILALLVSSAIALVTYTASVTVNPTKQLTTGATTASWNIYVNEVDQTRYLPGGYDEPILNADDSTTYAAKVVTDSEKVCAVKIELTSTVNASKFSNFNITVKSSTGGAWTNETLYASPTGTDTKAYIDGLAPGDVGYIHQATSSTKYYEVLVTYSFDKVDETTQLTTTFQYTPLPQNSF